MCSILLQNFLHEISKQFHLILPFFIFLIFLYKWLYPNNYITTQKNTPPSPPKLPILGHLHKLGSHPHQSLKSLSDQHGPIMLIYLGQKPTLIVSSSKIAKQIIKTHDSVCSNRPKSRVFDKLLYGSRDVAAAPYGEYWRQMKGILVLQLLSAKRVRSYRVLRQEETANLIDKIRQNISSEVNLSEMFMKLTNDVVCRAAFGRKYSEKNQNSMYFMEVLNEFVDLVGKFDISDFIPWLSWVNKVNGFDKRVDNVAKKFDLILQDIISEHLNNGGNYEEGENITKDFVDVLLEVQRDSSTGFDVSNDSIKALVLDAFAGGTETTSTVLDWTMTELLRHPHVMEKLQEEIRGIAKGEDDFSEQDLDKMKYLKAVIKEVFRLHPPIPLLIPRETVGELELNGYQIAPRTQIIVNHSALQRDPEVWDEPDEFKPERFLNSTIDFKGQDSELIPFGGGRRMCPGASFAMAIVDQVLAKLLYEFNWSLPSGVCGADLDMSESTGLGIHRRMPLLVVPTPGLSS